MRSWPISDGPSVYVRGNYLQPREPLVQATFPINSWSEFLPTVSADKPGGGHSLRRRFQELISSTE